jgi:hypothetical protein
MQLSTPGSSSKKASKTPATATKSEVEKTSKNFFGSYKKTGNKNKPKISNVKTNASSDEQGSSTNKEEEEIQPKLLEKMYEKKPTKEQTKQAYKDEKRKKQQKKKESRDDE